MISCFNLGKLFFLVLIILLSILLGALLDNFYIKPEPVVILKTITQEKQCYIDYIDNVTVPYITLNIKEVYINETKN